MVMVSVYDNDDGNGHYFNNPLSELMALLLSHEATPLTLTPQRLCRKLVLLPSFHHSIIPSFTPFFQSSIHSFIPSILPAFHLHLHFSTHSTACVGVVGDNGCLFSASQGLLARSLFLAASHPECWHRTIASNYRMLSARAWLVLHRDVCVCMCVWVKRACVLLLWQATRDLQELMARLEPLIGKQSCLSRDWVRCMHDGNGPCMEALFALLYSPTPLWL